MVDYVFKGIINLNVRMPFVLKDGIASFDVELGSFLLFNEQHITLEGITDSGKKIYLLVDHFYDCGFHQRTREDGEVCNIQRIGAVIETCVVMDSGSIDDIDSIGFYSHEIPKITNIRVSGRLNDDNASWMNIKKTLGKYNKGNREYRVSIGFVEEKPFYNGQMLVINADGKMGISEIKEAYWQMKKTLAFLYQKRIVPLEDVYLRNGTNNIGKLFVEKFNHGKYIFSEVKCLSVFGWDSKFSSLLQAIAENKIYLRHIPIFKDDETLVTPGRFLMGLADLEGILKSSPSDKHIEVEESVKRDIEKLDNDSNSGKKNERKSLKERIEKSIEENREFIDNFFPLGILGNDTSNIAADLANVRNALAHGDLGINLSIKNSYQMQLLMVYILYLQLVMIGFTKEEAGGMVPYILFER